MIATEKSFSTHRFGVRIVTKHPKRLFLVTRRRRRSGILGIPIHCVKKAEIMILTHESRGCDGESTSERINLIMVVSLRTFAHFASGAEGYQSSLRNTR